MEESLRERDACEVRARVIVVSGNIDTASVKRKMRFNYLHARNEHSSRVLDMMASLMAQMQKPELDVMVLIQEAATQIQKMFRFRWVMIGLLNQSDGAYRYMVHSGMREDAWARQRTRTYKYEDFGNTERFRKDDISKHTRVYLEEENQLLDSADQQLVNRPVLLRGKRISDDDTLEADFIDTLILGPNDELLGWIEYSGTITSKMPDGMTVRYIEMISSILATAIVMKPRMIMAPTP